MPQTITTLNEFLFHRMGEAPNQPLLMTPEKSLTTTQVAASVVGLAAALKDQFGVRRGSRVAILAHNRLETLLLLFAAALSEASLLPVNFRYSAEEVQTVLDDALPNVVFYDHSTQHLVREVQSLTGDRFAFVSLDSFTPNPVGSTDQVAKTLAQSTSNPHTNLLFLYTSGTTGALKGVPLTQANVLANVRQISAAVRIPSTGEALCVTPLFHSAIIPAALVPLLAGLPLILLPKFSPVDVVALLTERPITWTVLVPTMMQACVDAAAPTRQAPREHPLHIYYGASPAPATLIQEAITVFQARLIQSYGLTEATQAVTVLTPEEHQTGLERSPHLLRSAGRPIPETQVAIWDEQGRTQPPGTLGEIVVKGPQVMHGYWHRPDDSARVLQDGWLRTGDIGYLDHDGYLFVTDRLKDIIISGGENVFSPRVENILCQHPAVREAAVVGLSHPLWGETVHAVITLRSGYQPTSELAQDIVQLCRAHLAGFEIPRTIEFLPDLPKNATGKILKRVLRTRPVSELKLALDLRPTSPPQKSHVHEGRSQ